MMHRWKVELLKFVEGHLASRGQRKIDNLIKLAASAARHTVSKHTLQCLQEMRQ